jgi:UDP-glucose 4-epimerase
VTEPEVKGNPRPRKRTAGRVVGFKPAATGRPKVAVTGGSGYLGARFVRALAARGTWDIVVLDLAPAANTPAEVRHRFLDLNLPHSDGTVYRILKEEKPDVLVHLAGVRSPLRDAVYAHELNSIGTLNVFGAAGEANVKRLIHYSTTMVYGARGDNPAFLSEDHPMRADVSDHFVRDSVEAERHCRDFARRHPDARVAVLRFVPILAAERRDYRIRYLEGPVSMTMLGYDPLLQWLHPDDASGALLRTIDAPEAHGVFNIAPDGVLPLSSTLMLFGTLSVPLPHGLAYTAAEAAWIAGLGTAPGAHAHYLRYPCVADNEKARKVLGFVPRSTTLETVLEAVRERGREGRAVDFGALEEIARMAAYHLDRRMKRPASQGHPGPGGGEAAPGPGPTRMAS